MPLTLASAATAWALLLAGCGSSPRAPALRDEPVYQNNVLRFFAPDGWTLRARSDMGAGKVDKERLLVDYQRKTGKKSASFQLSLADLPATTDLADYLAGPAYGAEKWSVTAAAEEIEVGGRPGLRYFFTARVSKEPMNREVVCVRRGERVYFFNGLFAPDDAEARAEIRRTAASVIWKN